MDYTTNFGMKLPKRGVDRVKVDDLNDNTEDIDTLIHQNRTMIAPAFDSTKAYVVGDPVVYLGELFVFIADKAAGAWDATKVEPTTAAEMGGGGASALADLDDVEITSPTEGQALLYDDSDDKWKNGTLPDPSVVKEASGNPIELTDAASAPLVKCVTQITGYQQGSGTPSPDNIRPIVAYTEGEIEVRGVNLWNGEWEEGDIDATTGQDISGSGVWRTKGYISISPLTQYFVATDGVTGASIRPRFYDSNKNYIGTTTVLTGNAFNTPNNAMYLRFAPNASIVSNKTIGINYPSTYTTYEPYKGVTHTTTYPSAIYRGSEDCVKGEVTSEWVKVDLDSLSWRYYSNVHLFVAPVRDSKYSGSGSLVGYGCVCSCYHSEPNKTWDRFSNGDINIGSDTVGGNYPCVNIREDSVSTVSDFVTMIAGQTLAYELATPTTTPVTPTNLPIKSLSGYNHIESSTGEMEVEYITQTYQALVDLIQSSSHVYSTAEQVVGKWTDGKDLFEKTLVIQNFSASTADSGWYYGTVDLSDYGINPERLFPQQGETFIILQDTTPRIPIYIDWQGGTNLYLYFLGSRSGTLTVVVRYTKVTVSRSLSAPLTSQKAQIEPLSEKEEEIPVEEEKAVEKPETEEPENER